MSLSRMGRVFCGFAPEDLPIEFHDFSLYGERDLGIPPAVLVVQQRKNPRFLELETVTNVDMRRLMDHISVSKDGSVRVVLKKFEELA